MAKTSYIQIPQDLESIYKANLQSGDRYTFPRIVRKNKFISRERKNFLLRAQMISEVAELWNGLRAGEVEAWNEAAAVNSQRGYTLFTQNMIFRIKYGIPDIPIPDLNYQYKVGRIVVDEDNGHFKIGQFHPSSYYVQRKIPGTKSQYQPIEITELFYLPLTLSISYEANLEVAGPNPSAKFYAEIYHNYQGVTRTTTLEIPFNLSQAWTTVSNSLSSVIGAVVSYNLFIELVDVRGELRFDNIKAIHTGTNWARDHRCNNIDQSFTRAFYQVPKNWVPIIISDDSWFDSIYPT